MLNGSGNYLHHNQGELHPRWKGGRPHCLGCGKLLTHWDVKRCKSCANKGKLSPQWKGGKPKCLDCGKLLSNYKAQYCRRHTSSKDRHYNWKGGVILESKRLRKTPEYKLWRENVFNRDNYTCQLCGKRSKKGQRVELHPDHIKSFQFYPDLRFVVENGRTLCVSCHKKTITYGRTIKIW